MECSCCKLDNLKDHAVAWWINKRPISYDFNKHFENPTVNCFNDTEKKLAISIAEYLKS